MSQEIEQIKNKIDVADFLAEYIKLIPAGINFKANCPFHNEKTPSLIISPHKQIWHCFGCGEGGDIFTFLMKMESLEFSEALKVLAKRAGVVLPRSGQKDNSQKNRLIEINEWALRYWQKILLDSSQAQIARDYLSGRGVAEEIKEKFKLGYAIDSWDDLIKFLAKKGFSDEEIFLAGLVVKKNQGIGFYNRFRGRVMYPIIDHNGLTVGFGGRIIGNKDEAKYINSPQTILYNKSLILYGLYQAKEAIKKANLCILVEGYMDVIPSHQVGVKNVVAISGTALTAEQIRLIKRYTNNIALALDMDAAGQQAAVRSIELALTSDMSVKVITVPFGKDPGECIKNNPDDWRLAIESAKTVMDYFFDKAFAEIRVGDAQASKEAVNFLLAKINLLPNAVERDFWLKKLAQKINVSEAAIREEFGRFKEPAKNRPKTEVVLPATSKASKDLLLWHRIVALVLIFPQYFKLMVDNLNPDYLEHQMALDLYKKIILFYTKNIDLFTITVVDNSDFDLFHQLVDWLKLNNLSENTEKWLEQAYLLSQQEFASLDEREAKREILALVRTLKGDYLSRMIAVLKSELEQAEKLADRKSIDQIYLQLNDLVRQKNQAD